MSAWREQLVERLRGQKKIAVLGVGSVLCGDDAAGMLLIKHLEKLLGADARFLLMGGSTAPENFTGPIRSFQPDLLLVADAAHIGGQAGDIAIIDSDDISGLEFSTHMLPFNVLLDFLLREISMEIIVIGIQPDKTGFATEPSQAVIKAADELAQAIYAMSCL